MVFSTDSRLPPLGSSFLALNLEDRAGSWEDNASALSSVPAITLRHSHSFPGYSPHQLQLTLASEPLQHLACDCGTSPTQVWPDTDDEFQEHSPACPWMNAYNDEANAWVDTDDEEPVFSKMSESWTNDIWPDTDNEFDTSAQSSQPLLSVPAHPYCPTEYLSLPSAFEPKLSQSSAPFPLLLGNTRQQTKPDEGEYGGNEERHLVGVQRASAVVLNLAEITLEETHQSKHDREHHVSIVALLARCQQQKRAQSALGEKVPEMVVAKGEEIAGIGLGKKGVVPKTSRVFVSQTLVDDATKDSKSLQYISILEKIMNEQVTTLMVRNLPATLSQSMLLAELDSSGLDQKYDFCYIPGSFSSFGGSKGFAFVNFVSAEATAEFASTWHGTFRFGMSLDSLPLNISVASLQGFEANIKHWSSSRMHRIKNPELRPFVRQYCSNLIR